MSDTNLFLSLGDIIQLQAPNNVDIDNHIYLISYIDDQRLQLIDATNLDNPTKLELTLVDGNLTDENIEEIAIVDKAAEKGFARQKGLVPETWIDIYFGGDVPYVLTGKIASLDEDMIEIITHPEQKHIFIDFAYKGIPANLPITEINIRAPPTTPPSSLSSRSDIEEVTEADEDAPPNLQKYIAEGDEIIFSAQEEEMTQLVDVGETERRFAISQQSEDLLDELLAVIPTNQRTNQVMNSIHKMIARFKELRQAFSVFDEWGNPQKPMLKGANYKPLVSTLQKLNQKLYWILPVVENRRKIYYGDTTDLEDVMALTLADVREKVYTIEQQYRQNVVPGDQNKYMYLMRSLNPYWTPVAPPIMRETTLPSFVVNANITAIVNNNEDFFSSTYGAEPIPGSRKSLSLVHNTRFVLEPYTLGLTYLSSVRETPRKTTIQRVPLTPNDSIYIKNILTLPMPAVKYSKINLPATSILERTNLHLVNLNYWQLLGEKTRVNVFPASEGGEFLGGIQNMQMPEGVEGVNEDTYHEYLSSLIPKTKNIFKRIKDSIANPYSLIGILEGMEPFMVYDNDLTFQQYKRIIRFISEKNQQLKIQVVDRKHKSENYVDKKIHVTPVETPVIKEAPGYNIRETFWWLYSTSEILAEMLNSDGARVLTTQLSLQDIDLFGTFDIEAVDERIHTLTDQLHQEDTQDTCSTHTLAKRYIDIDELEEDNNKPIYFDKKYDETRYDIMNDLGKLKAQMDHTAFARHLKSHLEKLGVTTNIEREVEALLQGQRRVIDGDFAILMDDDLKMMFYKRIKDNWVPAPELKGDKWENLFCNLKSKCLKVKDTCDSDNVNQLEIRKKLMEDIAHHFENENDLSRERLQQRLTKELALYKIKLAARENLQQLTLLKYDLQKYHIGLLDTETDKIVSPRAELRELILMQTDFVKKQNDIKNFVARFCRIGEGEDESPFWYYDAELNVPLIPAFLKTLADAFEENRYQQAVERIAAQQGQMSDSGDAVVDRHSGYVIKQLDFVTLEEYDEKGFRIVSHDLLEKSMQDLAAAQQPVRTFESDEAKMIYNVVMAMSNYLSIKMDSEVPFIIKNVIEVQRTTFPSEAAYNKAMAGKKRAKTYAFAVQKNLLLLTLAFMILVIQTMIPSIVVHKTFPGCRRSIGGFPFEGDGDDGFLQYIACIIYNTKLAGTPWKTLKVRKKKGIERNVFQRQIRKDLVKRLRSHIEKYVLPRDNVKERIRSKKDYLTTYVGVDKIPDEHNITTWLTFLPPLQPLKLSEKRVLASSFVTQLNGLMEGGDLAQEDKISILLGRVIYRSLAIIQSIQSVVNKEAPLLRSSLDEPFLENVCCNVGTKNAIKYFSEQEPSIRENNGRVRGFERTLQLVRYLTMAPYLFDPADTRFDYPALSPAFSEETIYKAFIRYCRFNSGVLLGKDLKGVCIDNKSEFLITHTFEEKMAILKGEGKHYTLTHFYQLMKIVENKNIVPINLEPPVFSARPRLEALLDAFSDEDIQYPLLTMLRETLDYMEIEIQGSEDVMGRIKRYLTLSIQELETKILNFIQIHSIEGGARLKKVEEILRNLGKWRERGEGDYTTRQEETSAFIGHIFHKNIINIVDVYPQIIANNVDYEEAPVPQHWHLSPNHVGDVQSIIAHEFADLRTFYKNEELIAILSAASKVSQYIIKLIDILPIFMKTGAESDKTTILFGADVYEKIMHFYYLTILDEIILQSGEVLVTKKRKSAGQEFGAAKDPRLKKPMLTEVDIIEGQSEITDRIIAKYILRLLQHFEADKKILNLNNEMITERTLKIREKEKNRVTKNFQDLSIQQREIEKIMMNHRLGEWSVGLTRALYVYDEDQYEKDRERLEKEALEDIKLGKMGIDTEMARSIYKLDMIAEEQADQAAWKEAFDISDLPNDDDYGERDGDEGY